MTIALAQALKNAIVAEQDAEKFYLGLAARCRDEKSREILRGIAAQERRHAATLDAASARLVAGELPEDAEALARHIESAPAGRSQAGLSLVEALRIAVDAEDSAYRYYGDLASTVGGELATFLEHMCKEEAAHAAAIRALLSEMSHGRGE